MLRIPNSCRGLILRTLTRPNLTLTNRSVPRVAYRPLWYHVTRRKTHLKWNKPWERGLMVLFVNVICFGHVKQAGWFKT